MRSTINFERAFDEPFAVWKQVREMKKRHTKSGRKIWCQFSVLTLSIFEMLKKEILKPNYYIDFDEMTLDSILHPQKTSSKFNPWLGQSIESQNCIYRLMKWALISFYPWSLYQKCFNLKKHFQWSDKRLMLPQVFPKSQLFFRNLPHGLWLNPDKGLKNGLS